MSESEEQLHTLKAWLAGKGFQPLVPEELLRLAGPYRRLGWGPNDSEGMRFLATAVEAMLERVKA